ncbi:MAG: hypothetical protein ACREQ9_06790 [Candidatus Binatia bacterium]
MTLRCPLCNSGELSPVRRELEHEGTTLETEAHHCGACREVVLDGAQIARLRDSIRREGLAASEEDVERILERLMLQPG